MVAVLRPEGKKTGMRPQLTGRVCYQEGGEEVRVIESARGGLYIAGNGDPISSIVVIRWPVSWSLDATPMEHTGVTEHHKENRGG